MAFPWGFAPHPIEGREDDPDDDQTYLAVIHKYVWTEGCKYPGAPEASHVKSLGVDLSGYDAAVFGDNHAGFLADVHGVNVLNCGALMCRRADERRYKPAVGLLKAGGEIERVFLDTSEDKWLEEEEVLTGNDIDVEALISGLEKMRDNDSFDFGEAVERHMEAEGTRPSVKRMVLDALDKARDG